MDTSDNKPQWERQVLEKIALASLAELKAKRRWGIFFKLAGLAYLVAVLVLVVDWEGGEKRIDAKHTALINVRGTIEATSDASAERINGALQSAFEDKGTAGIVLRISSPGGSPVQAGIVYDEIRRLRAKFPDIPLYAVVEDMCASGGYYIASAADKIFVDKASIVGSIGVLMDGFGFTGAMERVGVERDLGVEALQLAVLGDDQRVDLQHRHVFGDERLVELGDELLGLLGEIAGKAERGCERKLPAPM